MEYNGRMEWFHTTRLEVYKGGAMMTDDKIVVYIKGHWETRIAAEFTPGWSEIGNLCWKYRGALQRHRVSKQVECYAYFMLSETCKELRFTKCIQSIQLVNE